MSPRQAIRRCVGLGLLLAAAAAAADDSAGDDWEFSITPYLWLATIDGSAGTGGVELPELNPDYSFFALDNLDVAGFITGEASKGRWSVLADAFYVSYSDRFRLGPLTAEAGVSGGAVEISGLYRPAAVEHLALIAGVRTISLELDLALDPGPAARQRETWVDPIVGVRVAYPLGDRWQLSARGDIGGFGIGSDRDVNLVLGAAVEVGRNSSLSLAYRHLAVRFKEPDYRIDLAVTGFLAGWQFRF